MDRPLVWLIFLRRKIEDQQAVDASLRSLTMETLKTELENRVHVGIKDDRHLRTGADLANAIEHSRNGDAGFQGTLSGELIDQAVGQRVGKWDSQFDDICAGLFESQSEVNRSRKIRIAGADVSDECFFVASPQSRETLVDSIWHSR